FGAEVRALQAARPGPLVRLLQRDVEHVAVPLVHDDLALDVDPGDVVPRPPQLVVDLALHPALAGERLRTQPAERPCELPGPLAHPAGLQLAGDAGLAGHP